MIDDKPQIAKLLVQAKDNPQKLDELFAWYRPYLRFRAHSDDRVKRLGAKLDASDIAQDALQKAYQGFQSFEGKSEPQLTSWLHTILQRTIEDAARKFFGPTRDVTREHSMNTSTESASLLFDGPTADGTSVESRMIQGESALELARLINNLPRTQADAIRMRHLERMPLKEIAQRMDKSHSAVAGLLKRGTTRLREAMRGKG